MVLREHDISVQSPPPTKTGIGSIKALVLALLVLTAGAVLVLGFDGEDSYAADGESSEIVYDGIEFKIFESGTAQIGVGNRAAVEKSITSIEIPERISYGNKEYIVTSIGQSAFYNCAKLEKVTIPSGVTSIGLSAFYNCAKLEKVTIPSGVTSIGNYAFSRCTALKEVTIPESVITIGYSAFSGCTALKEVTIPESVTSIGNYAFSGCTALKEVTIPSSVEAIGDSAFSGCTALESTLIPSGVRLGSNTFNGVCNGDAATPGGIVGHDMRDVSGQVATCTNAGYDGYKKCQRDCGYFTDMDGVEIADLNSWKSEGGDGYIPALGHKMTSFSKDATCTESGHKSYYQCGNCNKCFEDTEGGIVIDDPDSWKSEGGDGYIPASGHAFDDEYDADCNNGCGYVREVPNPPKDDNTMLFVGIGAVVVIIAAAGAFLFIRGRS